MGGLLGCASASYGSTLDSHTEIISKIIKEL
jgi:hypothetical protein